MTSCKLLNDNTSHFRSSFQVEINLDNEKDAERIYNTLREAKNTFMTKEGVSLNWNFLDELLNIIKKS